MPSEWIPVSERMPAPNQKVLGYDVDYERVDTATLVRGRLEFYDTDDCHIICWQPLPMPPNKQQVDAWMEAEDE